jgi:hypothetical protein
MSEAASMPTAALAQHYRWDEITLQPLIICAADREPG